MAITKTIEIAKIEVVGPYKAVQVATDTVIKEDGTELSRGRHRHVLSAGTIDADEAWVDTDISGESAEVQAICNAAWTNTVKTAYHNSLKS